MIPDHFVVYPCADPERGFACATRWWAYGYQPLVMTYQDEWDAKVANTGPIILIQKPKPWPGYYQVINTIVRAALDCGAKLITCIGDDMAPPRVGAAEHSRMYFDQFPSGFGVMQCTGDRQGQAIAGKVNSERICGSPTFGRAWAERAFGGAGAFGNYGFRSFYCDEMLHEVTQKMGVLYQEPELSIDHEHWSFGRSEKKWWHIEANENWAHDKALFDKLKAEGFPGHEPK